MAKNNYNEAIKAVNNQIRSFESKLEKHVYDYSSSDAKQKLNKYFDESFTSSTDFLKEHKHGLLRLEEYNCDSLCRRRRRKAAVSYAKTVFDKFSERYPNFCVEEHFIDFNTSFAAQTYNYADEEQYLSLAAAIWLCDELASMFMLQTAMEYFPPREEYENEFFPDITDTVHSRDILRAVYYIIRHRNDTPKKDYGNFCFVNEAIVKRSEKSEDIKYELAESTDDLTCRQRFDSLISFLNPVVLDRICKRFEEKSLEFIGLYFDSIENKYTELTKEREKLLKLLKKRKAEIESSERSVKSPVFPFSFPNDIESLHEQITSTTKPTDSMELLSQFSSLYDTVLDLEEKFEEIKEDVMLESTCDDREKFFVVREGKVIPTTKFSDFSVNNPYETLFALLYLIDSGSDIPWLYNQSLGVANAAANLLPWARRHIRKRDWKNEPEDFSDFDEDYELSDCLDDDCEDDNLNFDDDFSSQLDIPIDWTNEEAKLYERKYTDGCLWNHPENVQPQDFLKMSFPQIMYEMGLGVVPRNVNSEYDSWELFVNSGFSEGEAKILERYLSLMDASLSKEKHSKMYSEYCHEKEIDSIADYYIGIQDDTEDDVSSENDIEELREALKKLKSQIKEEHADKNRIKKLLENSDKQNLQLQDEIAEMRDYISKLEHHEEIIESEEETIDFPYTAKHRFVVFGGHETWSKSIKLKINNVRFVDAAANPNTELILHADAIFVQTNAMPHKSFNRIADLTRQYDIPMVYFSFASAEKCAEQLAKYDMNFKIKE